MHALTLALALTWGAPQAAAPPPPLAASPRSRVGLVAAPAGGPLRAGAARTDITPPLGAPLWGYGGRQDVTCRGVLDPLRARALVLEADGWRLALVSLDLGRAPPREITAAIQARVLRQAGVQQIFLVASHTHKGPQLEVGTWPTPAAPYVRTLERKLGDLIVEAAGNLEPARLGVASADRDLNRNRRPRSRDGEVDRQLLVLRVENQAGKVIAHAVNFAAHPTTLPASLLQYSADYPGGLGDVVEQETKAPCLFLQGACGDSTTRRKDGESGRQYGERLGRIALEMSRGIRCETRGQVTLRAREEAFRFTPRLDLSNPAVRGAATLAFEPELVAFYEREYREGVRPRLSVALLDGRIGFVGVSGEFFAGHALSLKRRARLEHLFFLGYCNDYHQYFPTIEASNEGGYGTEPLVSPVEYGAGERVMDRALIHLYQLRGKLPETRRPSP
jgi:hypothetical protein